MIKEIIKSLKEYIKFNQNKCSYKFYVDNAKNLLKEYENKEKQSGENAENNEQNV